MRVDKKDIWISPPFWGRFSNGADRLGCDRGVFLLSGHNCLTQEVSNVAKSAIK